MSLAPLGAIAPTPAPRVLDFDCEARPDAYLGGDLTTRSLTAIAAAWTDDPDQAVESVCLVAGGHSHMEQLRHMLAWFREVYEQADIVTGHNILRYDLPVISGSMVYAGMGPLPPKLASDTQLHGPKSALTFSRSMENMADMLGVEGRGKHHMNNATWKRANTLDVGEIDAARERVTSDVLLHMELRKAMVERGLLKLPKVWRP